MAQVILRKLMNVRSIPQMDGQWLVLAVPLRKNILLKVSRRET